MKKIIVSVVVSDPWEFFDNNVSNTFSAIVLDSDDNNIVLCANKPIILSIKKQLLKWTKFIGTQRYPSKNTIMSDIATSGCHCNLLQIPNSVQTCVEAHQYVNQWRGGGGMIATVKNILNN
jgi:hypothetical protein